MILESNLVFASFAPKSVLLCVSCADRNKTESMEVVRVRSFKAGLVALPDCTGKKKKDAL